MIEYLLDTSALAILDPHRGLLTAELKSWFIVREPRLYLPTIAVFEAVQGIERLALNGKLQRAAAIQQWLEGIIDNFGDRILPLDLDVSRTAGKLSAMAFKQGNHPGTADISIAATAQVHGLLLLTRNLKHFVSLGIDVADPVVALPP